MQAYILIRVSQNITSILELAKGVAIPEVETVKFLF